MTLPTNPLSGRGTAEALKGSLTEQRDKLIAETAGGSCKSFEAYRENVGRIRGLKDAIDAADHILAQANKPDKAQGPLANAGK